MNNAIQITSKNQSERELEVVQILNDLLQKYKFPIFTNQVEVESKVIPHSHPVLTLNTSTKDPLLLLQTLIHEQLHWFVTDHPKKVETIEYLKKHYEDNGECNVSGKHPDSFWEHIIVCFNTLVVLKTIVTGEELKYIYDQWQAYPKTEKLVKDNFEQIESELKNYNMIVS